MPCLAKNLCYYSVHTNTRQLPLLLIGSLYITSSHVFKGRLFGNRALNQGGVRQGEALSAACNSDTSRCVNP